MSVELKIPSVGESVSEVEIGSWLKSPGDRVAKDEDLVTIESEKASVELPSPASGRLSKILKDQGETAAVGDVIAYIDDSDEDTDSSKGKSSKNEEPKKAAGDQDKASDDVDSKSKGDAESSGDASDKQSESGKAGKSKSSGEKKAARDEEKSEESTGESEVKIMPAARRVLEEHGLKADEVEATGPGGRLLKEDVLKHIEKAGRAESDKETKPDEAEEHRDGPPGREEEAVPMSLLRRTIAQRLVEAQQTAALLTTFNEIDMQAVLTLRKENREVFQKRHETKLGIMSFFVKACVDALKQVPQLNAEIRGKKIVYRNYYDIGIAIGGGKGLVVPILQSAERLSFGEIEQAIRDFGQRAQRNQLKPEELQGGTFTISNGGVYGSLLSTPIVNPPQSGVLGLHAIQERPVAIDGQVVIRPMMYVALTYDHRIVDGREAVTFLKRIKEVIESPARMLIEA